MENESELEPFHDKIGAFLAHETPSTPAEGYLMRRDPAARPAPNLQQPTVEIRILLQGREIEERQLPYHKERETKPNEASP